MPLMDIETLLQYLQIWVNTLGISVSEISRRSGVHKSTISRILNGYEKKPSYENIRKIWNALEEIQSERIAKLLQIDRMINRNIFSVNPSANVNDIISIMVEKDYSVIPVMDRDRYVGRISRRYILNLVSTGKNISKISVKDIMEKVKPKILEISSPLYEIIDSVMKDELVLIKDGEKIIGIITWWDILKNLRDIFKRA